MNLDRYEIIFFNAHYIPYPIRSLEKRCTYILCLFYLPIPDIYTGNLQYCYRVTGVSLIGCQFFAKNFEYYTIFDRKDIQHYQTYFMYIVIILKKLFWK